MQAFRVQPPSARHLGSVANLEGLAHQQPEPVDGVGTNICGGLAQKVAAVPRGAAHPGLPGFGKDLAEPREVLDMIVAVDFLQFGNIADVDVDAVGPSQRAEATGDDAPGGA